MRVTVARRLPETESRYVRGQVVVAVVELDCDWGSVDADVDEVI